VTTRASLAKSGPETNKDTCNNQNKQGSLHHYFGEPSSHRGDLPRSNNKTGQKENPPKQIIFRPLKGASKDPGNSCDPTI